jgi:hypothetical protein
MKTNILLIYFLIINSILIASCNNEKDKKEIEYISRGSKGEILISEKESLKIEKKTRLIQNNNVIEISQSFFKKNEKSNTIGDIVEIDLSTTSGAMISAYSKNKGEYSLFFRTFEKNSWSNWIKLGENKEVKNPNRKVFSPKSLNNTVSKLQFKSNETFNEKVIFRIYTFKKQ